MRVTVVGAGVVGLTTAVCLRSLGVDADVVSRDAPEATTSAVAAALWYPYRALPADRVTAWSAASYAELSRLAGTAGVRMLPGTEILEPGAPDPWWRDAVPDLRRSADGLRFAAPAVDMSVHLPWLVERLHAAGGRIEQRAVASLDELEADVVVNCAGLGARELAGDENGEPDPATTEAIRARCAERVPAVRDAAIVDVAVGLRPARPSVRLEREGRIVHCYGHGGAGVTLAFGCAVEVAALLGLGGGALPSLAVK